MPSRLSVVHIATFMLLSWRLFNSSFKFVKGTTTENENIIQVIHFVSQWEWTSSESFTRLLVNPSANLPHS